MKLQRAIGIGLFLMGAFYGACVSAEEVCFRSPEVIPCVREVTCQTNIAVRLDNEQRIVVRCPDVQAGNWVRTHLKSWFGLTPKVEQMDFKSSLPAEG